MSSDETPPSTPVVTPSLPSLLPSDGRFDGFSEAMVHILREVFDVRDTDPVPVLVTSLHEYNIREMYEFIDPKADYEANPYDIAPRNDKAPRPVAARVHMTKVITLQAWAIDELAVTGNPEITDSEWLAFTLTDYKQYRTHRMKATKPSASMTGTTVPIARSNQATGSSSTTADVLFKKGIRRDPSLFPVLKDLKYYLVWHREFVGQCHAQDLSNIINPNYKPNTTVENNLFRLQQDFMYTVFQRVLTTDDTKRIVRKHEKTRDAQQIFTDLVKYTNDSPDADILVTELVTQLTTDRLDGRWTGTTKGFITNWEQKMAQYEELTDSQEHYSDEAKKRMLMNAVRPIKVLHTVQLQDELRVTADPGNAVPLNYPKYKQLLSTAATRYDRDLLQTARSRRASRSAHYTDLAWGEYSPDPIRLNMHQTDYTTDGDTFRQEILPDSSPPMSYEAYAAQQQRSKNRPWIPAEIWSMIERDPELRAQWMAYDWNKAPANRDINERRKRTAAVHELQANVHSLDLADDDGEAPAHGGEQSEPTLTTRDIYRVVQQAMSEYGGTYAGADTSEESEEVINTISPSNNALLAHLTQQEPVEAGNLRQLIHQSATRSRPAPKSKNPGKSTAVRFKRENVEREVRALESNMKLELNPHVFYSISNLEYRRASLMDRGGNGGLFGADVRLLDYCEPARYADVSGLANHTVKDLRIGTGAGMVVTQAGPIIIIMHQYAYYGKGKTIHSCGQWEHHGNAIDDRSMNVGGKQRVITKEGYVIPLQVRNGLPYIDMRPPTDEEMKTLPQILVTSDMPWDPKILDHEQDISTMEDLPSDPIAAHDSPFDAQGNYRHRSIYSLDIGDGTYLEMEFEDYVDACVRSVHSSDRADHGEQDEVPPVQDPDPNEDDGDPLDSALRATDVRVRGQVMKLNDLRPYFLWQPADIIRRTIENTTQFGRITPDPLPYKVRFRTPYPAANVRRRNEAVSADTVYSDTPAVDGGETAAILYFGLDSNLTTAHGIKNDDQFVNTLEDEIRMRGAMDKLITDSSVIETSKRVKDILRSLIISDWQSKPYHQHQNPVERRYQTVKRHVNTLMNYTGAPASTWLLALMYVCYVLNRTACAAINFVAPLARATGQTPDISVLFQFMFWEKVYYATDDKLSSGKKPSFPSDPGEKSGRFVGFAETVGDVFTYKVLTDDTQKVIHRSEIRSAEPGNDLNRRISPAPDEGEPTSKLSSPPAPTPGEPPDGETEFVKSPNRFSFDDHGVYIDGNGEPLGSIFKTFKPEELLHRSYLTPVDEKGQRFRARILEKVFDPAEADGPMPQETPDSVKFLVTYDHPDKADELIAYNEILGYIEDEIEASKDPDTVVWRFTEIVAHEGPLHTSDPSYKGSKYNVKVNWSDGTSTYEPLSVIGADDPVTCALYAKKHGLLDEPGWKRFKRIAKNEKKLERFLNQAKLRSKRTTKRYKFGFEVPRSPEDALRIDRESNNTMWRDSMALELSQLMDYETFKDYGHGDRRPAGYKRIRTHWVFDIKHDGRHKSRLVAGGHLTDAPLEDVYSGVVSLRSLRLVLFIAELNQLETWGADIGNAYLEAKTQEKVYVIGDQGFGELQGHTLVIYKALYGLKSSGKRWHERLYDVLRELGFYPSRADSNVWMRDMGTHYEYIAVYVDDLCLAMRDPGAFVSLLKTKYKFKIKGDGPISYHLGCNFGRDKDGTLFSEPRQYIEKMLESYERLFGEPPQAHYRSPLEPNDHPELDESAVLNEDGRAKYLSLIGQLQWLVTLGRFDVMSATTTMARFRTEPRVGHLNRLKRIYGYLKNRTFRHGAIRFRTGPVTHDLSKDVVYDWERTVYGPVSEIKPRDAPPPRGPAVTTTTYCDANLYHDKATGRALSGVLHFVNGTPIDWYCKRQATVETATYGSEFVVARIATEHIIDIRTTLRYLGVDVDGPSYLFGDNQSVVTSSTVPSSVLNKRSSALNYHRVREAIAAKILKFLHIPGKENPADILSKHYSSADVWSTLQPLMFWRGAPQDPKAKQD